MQMSANAVSGNSGSQGGGLADAPLPEAAIFTGTRLGRIHRRASPKFPPHQPPKLPPHSTSHPPAEAVYPKLKHRRLFSSCLCNNCTLS